MSEHRQPLVSEASDETHVRLLWGAVNVLERSLVRRSVVRLRVHQLPRADLVGIDHELVILDPTRELVQHLSVVICADTRPDAVVPPV